MFVETQRITFFVTCSALLFGGNQKHTQKKTSELDRKTHGIFPRLIKAKADVFPATNSVDVLFRKRINCVLETTDWSNKMRIERDRIVIELSDILLYVICIHAMVKVGK